MSCRRNLSRPFYLSRISERRKTGKGGSTFKNQLDLLSREKGRPQAEALPFPEYHLNESVPFGKGPRRQQLSSVKHRMKRTAYWVKTLWPGGGLKKKEGCIYNLKFWRQEKRALQKATDPSTKGISSTEVAASRESEVAEGAVSPRCRAERSPRTSSSYSESPLKKGAEDLSDAQRGISLQKKKKKKKKKTQKIVTGEG